MRQFITEHLSNFIAPDGGGMLDSNDRAAPFWGCSLERTNNQNGILYLVHPSFEFVSDFPEFKQQYKEAYERHMASTEIEAGCHSRSCGDRFIIRQSHDNVLAMLIGGWRLNSTYSFKVFKFLESHNFNYNVADPNVFDIKCQLQGGDIAIAHYVVYKTPPLWCVIYLAIGLAFTKKWNLADLRISFLREIIFKDTFKQVPKLHSFLIFLGMAAHGFRRGTRASKFRSFDFPAIHPFVKFLEAKG